ncbi:MAG: DUF2298 domain-containing protein [Clostridia bacterium]|nr:DUF2298 domain-containing protein [Clostridia bacterium]MDY5554557.1 DUF2298 domain-containing protein [Blautia sp.]
MKFLIPKVVLAAVLAGLSAFLLKGDVWTFWTWWLLAFLMGMVAMPVTGKLFSGFDDKGWIFSKVFAIAVTGLLTWFLVSVKLLPFTATACIGVSIACGICCMVLFHSQVKKGYDCFPMGHGNLIYWEEILFFLFFLLWTYLAGFRPQAYGTEKFMDYGFMEAMMRSTKLPAQDLWYSEGTINYYYGGQYFAVFLTKLSGSRPEITYNLMRTFVAAFAFCLPFSLVYQMLKDRLQGDLKGKKKIIPSLGGILAGLCVSIAGNMHYVIYSKIIPWMDKLQGKEPDGYWFPDATRYIGYNPDVPDKTIHEFPCYSFVLGDLHAHVVNVMFVLFLTGLLYSWMRNIRMKEAVIEKPGLKQFWKRQLLMPHILLAAVFIGMFRFTNFWDFIIYFVVTGGVVLFTNIIQFQGKTKKILAVTAAQAVEVLAVSYIVVLPFTLQFDSMFQGVGIAQFHSRIYQLLILWGLPVFLTVLLFVCILWEKLRHREKKGLYSLMKSISVPDLFAIITGLCAIGLVLIPEFVYVRDIYENGNARANTMFKLTYQAFMLFGVTIAYGILRILAKAKQKVFKILSAAGLVLVCWTFGYFGNSVNAWFGNVLDPSGYKGQNAAAFLETDFPEDASAIRWLKANIEGSPVVLEANGDSYTGFERVSAMTGLPTVLGWYVHEWLWRNDTADLNVKSKDIESIYTSSDEEYVRNLIKQYDISYIFVGSKEREKYESRLNETLLQKIGTKVFQSDTSATYILKIQ